MRIYDHKTGKTYKHDATGTRELPGPPEAPDPAVAMRVGLITGVALLAGLALIALFVPPGPQFPHQIRTLCMWTLGALGGLMFLCAGFLYTRTRD